MHFMGGVIIPRQALWPWRAHLLASTLPAVARATAACFVWCEWVVGRGVGLLRGPSSGWCVRSSTGSWSIIQSACARGVTVELAGFRHTSTMSIER